MKYAITVEGFSKRKLTVEPPGFLTPARLFVDDKPAPKGHRPGQLIVRRDDGKEVVATFKPRLLGLDWPTLEVDGKTAQGLEPLPYYQLLWCAIPLTLIFIGGSLNLGFGFLGAVVGLAGMWFNAYIFRTEMHKVLKYTLTAGVAFAATLIYVFLAMSLFSGIA